MDFADDMLEESAQTRAECRHTREFSKEVRHKLFDLVRSLTVEPAEVPIDDVGCDPSLEKTAAVL